MASGHPNSLLQMGGSHSVLSCRPLWTRVSVGLVVIAQAGAVEERMAALDEPLRECWMCGGVANCLVRRMRR